jgi:hypothetical protein
MVKTWNHLACQKQIKQPDIWGGQKEWQDQLVQDLWAFNANTPHGHVLHEIHQQMYSQHWPIQKHNLHHSI